MTHSRRRKCLVKDKEFYDLIGLMFAKPEILIMDINSQSVFIGGSHDVGLTMMDVTEAVDRNSLFT